MPKLKAFYEKQEDIPAGLEDYYVLRAEKYMLEVEGLRTDADVLKLQTALTNEKTAHRATKDKYAPIADLDIAEVIANLDRIPELEAAAGTAGDQATKVQQLVDAKLAAAKAPLERELTALKTKVTAQEQEIGSYAKEKRTNTLEKAVLTAAREVDVDPSMEDDVLRYAHSIFDVDEQGNVVTKDGVGVTPGIDPKSLLTDMIQKKPRWFKESVTANLSGGNANRQGAVNPWKAETKNLTEQGRLIKADPTLARNLAKQAGVILDIA